MKRILVCFLVLLLAFPMLSPWGTLTYFVLNREYIKAALCENRSRPQLHCDGKCFLSKKLKQQQAAADKEATESIKGICWLPLYCNEPENFRFVTVRHFPDLTRRDHIPVFHESSPLSGIFRPPRT